ncbi:MAG: 1-deoxy-D-xylulose-5-phosphate reductoisomerase [Flavobacteriaceae bacterium]
MSVPTPLRASAPAAGAVRSVSILGVTGSIGVSTLDVIAAHPARFRVEAVAAGRDVQGLARAAIASKARFAAIAEPSLHDALKAALSGSGIECGGGATAVVEAAEREADLVVGGIVGSAGLRPTLAAARRGATVALANKECLVAAGTLFMREAAAHGARILPVDSEHSAVFQSLDGSDPDRIRQVILTASGGPFRTWHAARLAGATPEDALNHPTWSMGAKVTIDSATLMNKGLELIEAHHLFALPAAKLGVLIQPQSIVHALVAYVDGSVIAQMGSPDMRGPISYALGYPERIETAVKPLDLASLGTLHFEEPDRQRFPALDLALGALEAGDAATAALNGANEVAVAAFLSRKIGFLDIAGVVSDTLDRYLSRAAAPIASIEDAMAVDSAARSMAFERIARLGDS